MLQWIKAWEAGGSQVPQMVMGGNSATMMMPMPPISGSKK